MRFLPLGVGDAFSALYYSSCMAVESGGHWILIDCPHPIQKMIREAGLQANIALDPSQIEGVVLTHLHADHSSGLEGFSYYFHFYLQKRLKLLAHPRVISRLWEGHLAAGMEQILPGVEKEFESKTLQDFFEIIPLSEEKAVEFGKFSIESRFTIHHIPTTAVRISAGGRTLGHSADTAFDPSLIEWLSKSDLIVHETNYGVHTPYEKLAELPESLRKKMRLNHYPDQFEAKKSSIEALEQGKLYSV